MFGLGGSSSSVHKDVYKVIKQGLTDKQHPTRVAAAKVRNSNFKMCCNY